MQPDKDGWWTTAGAINQWKIVAEEENLAGRTEQKVGKLLNYFPGHRHTQTHTRAWCGKFVTFHTVSQSRQTINCQIRIKYFVGIKTEAYRMNESSNSRILGLMCTGISRRGNLKEPINSAEKISQVKQK